MTFFHDTATGKMVPCEVIRDYGKRCYVQVLDIFTANGKRDWSNTDRYGSTMIVEIKNLTR